MVKLSPGLLFLASSFAGVEAHLPDVTCDQMTYYQLAPGNERAKTYDAQAGSIVGFVVDASISHLGPLSFWLSKAPNAAAD
ncbi:hypothetical protein MKZ38_006415 [Zalerion maritima]|uniref:Uncharacterized protein n=1 Tax=Zalerion maritima TaxID=339359 RepID=A0AAD5RJU7_9PEZI|nr:hypothetical protein MKZ38_006415 [Zalerion maritima]